jgi:hypothetical protein
LCPTDWIRLLIPSSTTTTTTAHRKRRRDKHKMPNVGFLSFDDPLGSTNVEGRCPRDRSQGRDNDTDQVERRRRRELRRRTPPMPR